MSDEFLGSGLSLEDPVWPFVIRDRLASYMPYIREWWADRENLTPSDTGIYGVDTGADGPPGLFYRFTRSAIKSPIRGIQAFPFIVAGYLQISGVKGGSTKLIQRLLCGNDFIVDEFTCIELHNLPSTFNQGQLIAFIPTEFYEDRTKLGKWIYLTNEEISLLIRGKICESVHNKAILRG